MPPCRHACCAPPDLHASIPLYLHVAIPVARLWSSIPPYRYTCSAWFSVRRPCKPSFSSNSNKSHQTPSKFHACTPAVCLQSSPRKLPNSIPPRLHACSTPPRLHSSISAPPHPTRNPP